MWRQSQCGNDYNVGMTTMWRQPQCGYGHNVETATMWVWLQCVEGYIVWTDDECSCNVETATMKKQVR